MLCLNTQINIFEYNNPVYTVINAVSSIMKAVALCNFISLFVFIVTKYNLFDVFIDIVPELLFYQIIF